MVCYPVWDPNLELAGACSGSLGCQDWSRPCVDAAAERTSQLKLPSSPCPCTPCLSARGGLVPRAVLAASIKLVLSARCVGSTHLRVSYPAHPVHISAAWRRRLTGDPTTPSRSPPS